MQALGNDTLEQHQVPAGVDAVAMTQPELGAYMRAEYEKWGKVVRDAKLRIE